MTNKNKNANRSKISEAKLRQLVKLFWLDLDANQMAELTGLNRNTVNRCLKGIQQRIAEYCEQTSPMRGQIEVDESFFGAERPGKRGRGVTGKTIVFGLFKRNGKVYTEIVHVGMERTPKLHARALRSFSKRCSNSLIS